MKTMSEKEIFLAALDKSEPSDRKAFLTEACGDDLALRASVESLLMANEQPDNPLDSSPVAFVPTGLEPAETEPDQSELIGSTIGPYRLMEQIGEGGFGLVFVARQEKPVRRNVALKIVKPGTVSKDVIARFEAERQAVAMMDHPNIACVFDAGVTVDNRPFFVMELVRGVPITEFADARQMTIRQRLTLFLDVCSAVHHAHQKGVIHRDIKPSNVMVTLLDDKPVVKVIDFGVAKAIGQSLTDKTIYTGFFSMIGTPLYMSPEQAELSAVDVDTRSDIYSLGVLLYEILAGATPFDSLRLNSVGWDEMRRIIREEEPPRPSQRISTIGVDATTVSASRRVGPNDLTSSLSGDLDWIVMKALDKDRKRRYDSAASLATDIRRHLADRPIDARPPSFHYRLVKFSRRNRVALATGAAVLLSLALGTAVSLWQNRVAINERGQKEWAQREIAQFSTKITRAHELLAIANTHAAEAQWREAKSNFDAAVEQQPTYYYPWISRAHFLLEMNLYREASDDFAIALDLGAPTDSSEWNGVTALLAWTGREEKIRKLIDPIAKQLESEESIKNWEQLRACLATDDALSPADYAKLAETAANWMEESESVDRFEPRAGEPKFPPHPRPGDHRLQPHGGPRRPREEEELPTPVRAYISGLAHLRAGQFESAIQQFRRAASDQVWPSVDLNHAPLALAYHATGQSALAAESLSKASAAVTDMVDRMPEPKSRQQRTPWIDSVELLLFHREATTATTGKAPAPSSQLDRLRQRAVERLKE